MNQKENLDAARMTLISPPPEEELQRSNPKRKRQTPSKLTPNPKPRKATRRPPEQDSPTRHRSPNPNADWLPPPIRRSATPYEPPTDVFTPPREVLRTPLPAPKRRAGSVQVQVQAPTPLRVVLHSIKKELPPIDLNRAITPPSPSDDPLLLVSSSPIRQPSTSSSPQYTPFDWNNALPDDHDPPTTDSMDLDAPEYFDGPLPVVGGGWDSDSDSDGDLPSAPVANTNRPPRHSPDHTPLRTPQEEDRVTTSIVRTKPDPPTPHTAARAAAWGVWGSPYPGRGPDGAEEGGSFRMDGRRRTAGEASDPSASVNRGAFDFDFSSEEIDQDELIDEGVSILRALREEDAQRAMAMNLDSSLEPRQVDALVDAQEQDQEIDAQEEEEVRAMSVEAEDEPEQGKYDSETNLCSPTQRQDPGFQTSWLQQGEGSHARTPPTRQTPVIPVRTERLRFETPAAEDEDLRMDEPQQEDEVLSAVGTRIPSSPAPSKSPSKYHGTPSSGLRITPFPRGSPFVPADPDRDLQLDRAREEVADFEDGDDCDEDHSLLGLVKITSADPRAAARAAAILKQHDYDCFTRLQRRHSYAGVGKGKAPASPPKPRKSLSGMQDIVELRRRAKLKQKQKQQKGTERAQTPRVVGERVYFPGSPKPVTTAQLLAEAEAEVSFSEVRRSPSRDKSMVARMSPLRVEARHDRGEDEEQGEGNEQEWTKEDWKKLDACFTDERIALAARCGIVPKPALESNPFSTPARRPSETANEAAVMMAAADTVDLELVIARYVQLYGDKWNTESLTQRARALQNKQRAGHVAPPTPTQITRASSPLMRESGLVGTRRRASMDMPILTPLGRPPRPSRPQLPSPVSAGAPFSALPPTPEPARHRRVPGSLLAPRYSHLLEEAVAVSGSGFGGPAREPEAQESEDVEAEDSTEDQEQEQTDTQDQDSSFLDEEGHSDASFASSSASNEDPDTEMVPTTPLREREALVAQPASATITKRVKGFFFSYLPTLSKTTTSATRTVVPRGPRLPVPPPELLDKRRGPVTTPVRPPLPKARAPKELVTLQPAPPPAKKMVPASRAPQRLVELNHITPPKEEAVVRHGPRPRTSSGGSVKDLVKNFEALDSARSAAKGAEVKRVRSVGDLGKRAGAGRPVWRP